MIEVTSVFDKINTNDNWLLENLKGLPDNYKNYSLREKEIILQKYCQYNNFLFEIKVSNNKPFYSYKGNFICFVEYDGFDPYGNYLKTITNEEYNISVPILAYTDEIAYVVDYNDIENCKLKYKRTLRNNDIIQFLVNKINGTGDTHLCYTGETITREKITYSDNFVFTTLEDAISFISMYNKVSIESKYKQKEIERFLNNEFKNKIKKSKYFITFDKFTINKKSDNLSDKETGKLITPRRIIFEIHKDHYHSIEIQYKAGYKYQDTENNKSGEIFFNDEERKDKVFSICNKKEEPKIILHSDLEVSLKDKECNFSNLQAIGRSIVIYKRLGLNLKRR